MADPAPAAPPSPSPAPASPAPAPGSLTGTRYDAPISDAQFDRLGPESQSKYARVRNQVNNPEWVPRSDLAADPAKPAAAPGEPAPPAPAAPASVTEDGRLKVGDYELSSEDIASLMRTRAELDLRASTRPATPEAFELKLPDGFKMPEGLTGEFVFNEADPAIANLKRYAHAKGWSQSDLSDVLSFYASSEAQKEVAFRTAQAREVEKLGANGTSRVTAVETWLRSELGDDLANGMRSMMVTEKIVRGFEKLAGQRVTQGTAPFSQAHRTPEPSQPGRLSDADYEKLSQAERWEYARSFPQSQFYPDRKNGGSDR
jgi:hypothetical protein